MKVKMHKILTSNIAAFIRVLMVSLAFILVLSASVMAEVRASFMYYLSNFNGPVSYNWANVYTDKERNEIYAVNMQELEVRIFNENGMEVHRFGDDGSLGTINDMTVDSEGNIFVLSNITSTTEIIQCNFRGEPISKIGLKNLPAEFAMFYPNRIVYKENKFYLTDTSSLKIVITDIKGVFEKGYDVAPLLGIEDKQRNQTDINGFSVDSRGNMLFTIPVQFSAYRLSPEGKIEAFGKSGSGPGKFGVVAGIVSDEKGHIYVSDKLRCVVLIFNKDLEFKTEFGYRGNRPENLVVPNDLAIDNEKIYVAQAADRGVSVFKISYDD